ncbi:hypothetical protein [Leptolyngbya sp. CCNP1308]|uniref:hypothetical protein n=1 Tax=Leptolyngbya sp. CCNP1308 TaxID=3110255 RepID=UPI002B1FB22A|nr:hypothetical protein [Leptolyngbya sp. CCNP1308]
MPTTHSVATILFDDLGNQARLTRQILPLTVEERRKHEALGVISSGGTLPSSAWASL